MTVKSVSSTHEVETLDHVFGDMGRSNSCSEVTARTNPDGGSAAEHISLGDECRVHVEALYQPHVAAD